MIKEFLAHDALPEVSFLWPSLQLQSDDFYDVSEGTPFLIDRPMSGSRFLELFRGALIQIGVPPPEATSSGFNRLRRFLPTLPTCLQEGNDIWREFLPSLAQTQRSILRSVAQALDSLEKALASHYLSAKKVARPKRPAFVSCMTSLLRWPDASQGRHLLLGYPIVGEVATSGVFRAVSQHDKEPVESWLGPSAIEAVDKFLNSGPPKYSDEILAVTQEQQAKGFRSQFLIRFELDDQFGCGQWRPLECFLIVQGCGKRRAIDNGRKTGHNSHTTMHETISTTSVDSLPPLPAWSLLPFLETSLYLLSLLNGFSFVWTTFLMHTIRRLPGF